MLVCVREKQWRKGEEEGLKLDLTVTCIWTRGETDGLSQKMWCVLCSYTHTGPACTVFNLRPSRTQCQPFSPPLPTCMLLTDCDKTHKHTRPCQNRGHQRHKCITASQTRCHRPGVCATCTPLEGFAANGQFSIASSLTCPVIQPVTMEMSSASGCLML